MEIIRDEIRDLQKGIAKLCASECDSQICGPHCSLQQLKAKLTGAEGVTLSRATTSFQTAFALMKTALEVAGPHHEGGHSEVGQLIRTALQAASKAVHDA